METKVKIENLFLDPNNYRLRSHPDYQLVDKNSETKPAIQKRTFNLIAGSNNYLIHDLIESMKANGFLKVDNILVRKYGNEQSKYIVVEGNRRLSALMALKEQHEKGYDIGKLDQKIFEKGIEVVIYQYSSELDYLILMGLKHVSGNKKWDAYNQAKLVYQLYQSESFLTLEIAQKVGISKTQVERQLRGYMAIEEFIEDTQSENYGEKYNPHDKFMIFVELTNKPKLRKWVGFNEQTWTLNNQENKTRFFSWIKPAIGYDEETNDPIIEEPIIISHKQVRQLEEIIDDEESLQLMEDKRDFDFALNQNLGYSTKKVSKTIKGIEKALKNIPVGIVLTLSEDNKKSIEAIKDIVEKFLKALIPRHES